MLTIAVCDDSKNEIDQLLLLLEAFSYPNVTLSIQTFDSPLTLVKSIESGKLYDIYLLDIVMPVLSGIDIGSMIRQQSDDACIIYITNSTEYALNAYEISALQYLIKPIKKSALEYALNKAILVLNKRDKIYILDSPDGKIPIKHDDIIYIEYSNHVMHFYTANKIYVSKYIRVPFGTAVQQILKDPDFIKPHVSYIIHMKYVKKMRSMSFIMTKGYEVPISKNRQEDSKKSYMRYLLGEDEANV